MRVKWANQPKVKDGHIDIKVEVEVDAAYRGKKRVGKIKNCSHRLTGSSHNPPHLFSWKLLEYLKETQVSTNLHWSSRGRNSCPIENYWKKTQCFTFWGTEGEFFPDVAFLAPRTLLLLLLGLFVPFFFCFGFTLCCCLWNSKRSANLLISRPREAFWVFLLPHGSELFPEPLLMHLLTFLFLRLGNFCSSWKSFSRFESRLAGRCRFSLKECLWKFSSFSTPVLSFSESSSISFHSSSCTSSLCSSSPSGDKKCLVPKLGFKESPHQQWHTSCPGLRQMAVNQLWVTSLFPVM